MNITYTFKNFEPSEHLKKYAARRFEKLSRLVNKADNVEVNINMSVDKIRHVVEVKFTGDNLNISAVEQSQDMYASVDMILDKLESQLKKQLEKSKQKRRSAGGGRAPVKAEVEIFSYDTVGSDENRHIVGVDHFEPKPLFVDEAAMQLQQRDDEFLVFLNADTENVNVLYKRANGTFGLIVPGF
ncbi:MAG: ribosome-associated translation inhibitor RaiA [Deltaproteobacteria bacterium]|jgi:putative sigma-54 modulation protein|nr:ribosome-associated translation inhibitor RaiA [Deltaproteobacteria bacterium]